MDFDPANKSCSFCGKQGSADTKLAGGLGAMICGECLAYYSEVFSSEDRAKAITRPPWDAMTDADILGTLPRIAATASQVNNFLNEWVQLARSRKLSWAEIGKALGVSRQAAWERFTVARSNKEDATA